MAKTVFTLNQKLQLSQHNAHFWSSTEVSAETRDSTNVLAKNSHSLTGGMELNELQILVGDSSSRGHGRTIAGAGVGRGAGEVCTSAAAGR